MKHIYLILFYLLIFTNVSGQNICFEYSTKEQLPKVAYQAIKQQLIDIGVSHNSFRNRG